MTFKEKILGIISAIGAFFAAVFYVLFQLKKEENLQQKNEALQKENERLNNKIQEVESVTNTYKDNIAKTEDAFSSASHGDVDAGVQLMHQLSENGKKRNGITEK